MTPRVRATVAEVLLTLALAESCASSPLAPLAVTSNAAADEIDQMVAAHESALQTDLARRLASCAPGGPLSCSAGQVAAALQAASPEAAALWVLAELQRDAKGAIAQADACRRGRVPGCDEKALTAAAALLVGQLEVELAAARAKRAGAAASR